MTMRGTWIWLRPGALPRVEECLPHLDGVVIPLHNKRGAVHYGPTLRRWIRDWTDAGRPWWAMDHLTGPVRHHLPDLFARAQDIGAAGVMVDAEPDAGWRDRVREATSYRHDCAELRGGLDLAVTDYARGGIGTPTLSALLDEVDGHRPIGVPQSYDPGASYEPDYHARSVAYWRSCGAERVVLGVGAWLRSRKRHRTPEELRRHIEHVPADVDGLCAWYADDDALDDGDADTADDLLPVLGAWPGRRVGHRSTEPAPADQLDAAIAELEVIATRLKATHPVEADRVASLARWLSLR